MNFETLARIRDLEERLAAAEAALQVLQERAAAADAVRMLSEDVESLKDWRDSQSKPRRTLTIGNRKDRDEAVREGDQT